MDELRIGAVSYLNTRPLVFGLSDHRAGIDLSFDLPSRLADRLAAGELDVALIPVVEAVTNPQYAVVSNACIACRGPVSSVKLYGRVPAEQIRTVSLDEGSRTSAALTRIILKQKYALEPEYIELPIDSAWQESDADAVLVIGDRAMNTGSPTVRGFQFTWDLGEFWFRWTELPFVFAVWAARPGVDCGLLEPLLSQARDNGLNNLTAICQSVSQDYPLDESACRKYLTEFLHYHLGPREKLGLKLFLEFAEQQSIIQSNLNLQFHDCQTTG